MSSHWFVRGMGLRDSITETDIILVTRWWSPRHLFCLHVREGADFRCATRDEAASWLAYIMEVGVAVA